MARTRVLASRRTRTIAVAVATTVTVVSVSVMAAVAAPASAPLTTGKVPGAKPPVAVAPTGAGTVPGPTTGWVLNGSASVDAGGLQLTPASTYVAGSAFWPVPMPTSGLTVSFTATMRGGTGGDGLALVFADPSQGAKPTSLGVGGGGLGFSGIPGVAVALDTVRKQGYPSNNFVGISAGPTSPGSSILTFATTTTTVPLLRPGTNRVSVSVRAGTMTVAVGGRPVLAAPLTVPPQALVGFSAGTGSNTDAHTVSRVDITSNPAAVTGPGPTAATTAAPTTTAAPPTTSAPTTAPPTTVASTPPGPAAVTASGTSLLAGGQPWIMDAASFYQSSPQAGISNPDGTVALARSLALNTVRIINFYATGSSNRTAGIAINYQSGPFSAAIWDKVDVLIAKAQAAGLHIDLSLADYRNILQNSGINPYTYDWSPFIDFVANRVNTVTGVVYKDDPTIAYMAITGEPFPPGQWNSQHAGRDLITAGPNWGQPISYTYSRTDLTNFYASVSKAWKATGARVLVSNGGFGYLDYGTGATDPNGIDWQTILSLPSIDLPAVKTYVSQAQLDAASPANGGMLGYTLSQVMPFCAAIGKPLIDEEFGFTQSLGDLTRAADFTREITELRAAGLSGTSFWNANDQLSPTSYDVAPSTTPAAANAIIQLSPA